MPQARRIALAAQGFGDAPLDRPVDTRALTARVLGRVRLLQIDSVNVLERAHYLPAFSRLGPYDRTLLDRLSGAAPRRLFEYWGHEASLLPVELWPLLQWRMARAHDEAWGGMRRIATERPELVAAVRADIAARGPLSAGDLAHHDAPRGPKGPWWDWSDVKRALEYLFWSGEITSARRVRFERRYDLPERVIPAAVRARPIPEPADAQRELLRIAAGALASPLSPICATTFGSPPPSRRRAWRSWSSTATSSPSPSTGGRSRRTWRVALGSRADSRCRRSLARSIR